MIEYIGVQVIGLTGCEAWCALLRLWIGKLISKDDRELVVGSWQLAIDLIFLDESSWQLAIDSWQ